MKKWFVTAKRADFNKIAEKYNISPMIARLIRNRDVVGDMAIQKYLWGGIEDLYAPWDMKGITEGVDLIRQTIENHEKIRVIGDYDIDGVNATYILLTGLIRCKADVDSVIPERIKDGYGLNKDLITKAHEDGVLVIITCDNGIAATPQIEFAKELGMTVIVTDHHEVPFTEEHGTKVEILPPADVIINPKQEACKYPFKGLCGAAVAWKLVWALYESLKLPHEEVLDMLENVAFATIGDIMELKDENRILVKEGLKRIHNTHNYGIEALIYANGLKKEAINTYHIGFVLGPCINAGGRLDTAKRALELLCSHNSQEADRLAGDLKALNDSRKELTQLGVAQAEAQIEKEGQNKDMVLVVYLKDCHESIAGIIAGRLKEKYYKPCIVLTDSKDGLKGSGRSIPQYSMFEELNKCKELFTNFGGHPMAAGVSLAADNLNLLRKQLNENTTLKPEDIQEKVSIDFVLPLEYVTEEFIEELTCLMPYGNGNEKPLFAEKNISVCSRKILGSNQNVMKLMIKNVSGCTIEAMYFGNVQEFSDFLDNNLTMSITYYPTVNEFRGERTLQVVISDFKP